MVGAAAGGAPELVDHGKTGYLVQPDDPAAFAAMLDELVQEPELRRRLGESGVAAARSRTWGRSVSELREAYARVVGVDGVRRPAERLSV